MGYIVLFKSHNFNSTKVQFGDSLNKSNPSVKTHFNSTKVQFGEFSERYAEREYAISIPLRYNLESFFLPNRLCYSLISIPLRYNLEIHEPSRGQLASIISIPLRYNLEEVCFRFFFVCVCDFNSTKVQFGGEEKGQGKHIYTRISIPLRYNLEDLISQREAYRLFHFNSTKVQFGV